MIQIEPMRFDESGKYYVATVTAASTLCCAWCGKSMDNATQVTYLNGNQPVCDLCLLRAGAKRPPEQY
jgi:hypothetical protein